VILVDTCAWIEWLIGSETGDKIDALLPEQSDWLVPTMVQLELAKWLRRETDEARTDQVIAYIGLCVIAELDSAAALEAARGCAAHKLATADAIIYATARNNNAELDLRCTFQGARRCQLRGASPALKLAGAA